MPVRFFGIFRKNKKRIWFYAELIKEEIGQSLNIEVQK